MIHKTISVFLFIIFLVYVNNSLFSYFLFKTNQEKIVSDCCEKIVVNCEGKCYLLKTIDENDNQSPGEKEKLNQNTSPVLYHQTNKDYISNSNKPKLLFQYYPAHALEGHSFLEDNPPKI